jgi:hypothetical protein
VTLTAVTGRTYSPPFSTVSLLSIARTFSAVVGIGTIPIPLLAHLGRFPTLCTEKRRLREKEGRQNRKIAVLAGGDGGGAGGGGVR